MTSSAQSRRAAERWGRIAEWVACFWLIAKGYRVLARRARTPFGEVDILALKGDVLAAVEVKARPTRSSAFQSVGPRQQDRTLRALSWLSARMRLQKQKLRCDLFIVPRLGFPLHVRGAWSEGER